MHSEDNASVFAFFIIILDCHEINLIVAIVVDLIVSK